MFTLDLDLMGLIMVLLTFFIPVISSILDKKSKNRKKEMGELGYDEPSVGIPVQHREEPVEEGSGWEELIRIFEQENAADEQEGTTPDSVVLNDTVGTEDTGNKIVVEPLVEEVPEEGISEVEQHIRHLSNNEKSFEKQQVQPVVEARQQEKTVGMQMPEKEDAPLKKGLKERLKENPADMVIFAEIMNPKFKEF